MTTCIRQRNSVWTTCTCEPCRAEMRYKSKLHRNGLYHRVPSEAAWKVVETLRAQGWTMLAIASAAGIGPRTIQAALWDLENTGRRTTFGPAASRKLVNHGDPTEGQVAAQGTARRLQGLARQQFNLELVATETGIGFSTLAAIRARSTERVASRFYTTIRDYADPRALSVGPSTAAATHAIRKGWCSLLAWDDIDNDPEPQSTPTVTGRPEKIRAHIENLEWLADTDESLTSAAARLGLRQETIRDYCTETNRSDLYWRLAGRENNADHRKATRDGMGAA